MRTPTVALLALLVAAAAAAPSFVVKGNDFLKDGYPFRIISGAFHYFRTPAVYWADRLNKMKLGGLNTVETYVAWNLHEPKRGQLNFAGDLDLRAFIEAAQAAGLNVIVRPPPFICAEWEFGGLPAWLLEQPDIVLRGNDPKFLEALTPVLHRVAQIVAPLQYSRGGPVIAMQIENEYGNYGNDKTYLAALRQIVVAAGANDVVFFSSNGAWEQAQRNGIEDDGVLHTVNFGNGQNVPETLAMLRKVMPTGPLFVTEFWDGWYDKWSEKHHTVSDDSACETLDAILKAGASVNIYMYTGGTNFGLMSGANLDGPTNKISPLVTSYDYDSPISENGDVKTKWSRFRDVIGKYAPVPSDAAPEPSKKGNYGKVSLTAYASLLDDKTLQYFGSSVEAPFPLSFSQLKLDYGFILYETSVLMPTTNTLAIYGLADRATIYVDGDFVGALERMNGGLVQSLKITTSRANAQLRILVENTGRNNYGVGLKDDKGILSGVTLGDMYLFNWTMYPLAMGAAPPSRLPAPASLADHTPAFYKGTLKIEGTPLDTFLDPSYMTKGIAYVNGINIGRYWPARGPQVTLYIPASYLKKGSNEIILLEVDQPSAALPTVSFTDTQNLG